MLLLLLTFGLGRSAVFIHKYPRLFLCLLPLMRSLFFFFSLFPISWRPLCIWNLLGNHVILCLILLLFNLLTFEWPRLSLFLFHLSFGHVAVLPTVVILLSFDFIKDFCNLVYSEQTVVWYTMNLSVFQLIVKRGSALHCACFFSFSFFGSTKALSDVPHRVSIVYRFALPVCLNYIEFWIVFAWLPSGSCTMLFTFYDHWNSQRDLGLTTWQKETHFFGTFPTSLAFTIQTCALLVSIAKHMRYAM